MLVDLGRNDLGRVARPGTVTTSQYMEVERYSHVLHLVSHVEAQLRPELDALDALRSVFPAGTLTGAPKIRAMQLIAAAEGERRGLYGGAVGYLGYDGNLDTAITIRSAVLKDGQAHVHTGAGHRREERPGERVRGDRAQGRGAPPGDRARRGAGRPATRGRPAPPAAGASEPPEAGRPMILVIDNYDSFTFNLVQALQAAGADVRVVRNDQITRAGVEAHGRRSRTRTCAASSSRPGPATRTRRACAWPRSRSPRSARIPLLGVCLGMQSMGAAWGASIVRAPTLVHGEASDVHHDGDGPPRGHARRTSRPPATTRCAWTRPRSPTDLYVTATSPEDGVVMGLRHRTLPIEGVQFHPESVLTPDGPHLLANFLRLAGEGEASLLDAATGSFATRGMTEAPRRDAVADAPAPPHRRSGPPDERAGPGRGGGDRGRQDAVHGRRAPARWAR